MSTLKYSGILVSVLIASSAVVCAGEYEKILRHEFPDENIQKAYLEADIGDVKLSKSTSGRVEVVVSLKTTSNSRRSADSVFANCRAEFLELEPGKVKAAVKSEKSGMDWIKFWKKHPQIEIEYFVPNGIDLDVASGAGDVRGGGLDAKTRIATGAGDVDINGLRGSLNVATGAGDVRLMGFHGSLNAATGAGDFDGAGTFSRFSISTGAGDVELRADNPFSEDSQISTGAGDIVIAMPVSASFNLAADVGFGDIVCLFDIVDSNPDKKSFRGVYNEGVSRLRLSTGLGDVFVQKH